MTRVRVTLDRPGGFVRHVYGTATGRRSRLSATYAFASCLYTSTAPREVRWRLIEVRIDGEASPRMLCSSRVHDVVAVHSADAQARDDGGGGSVGGLQQQHGAK